MNTTSREYAEALFELAVQSDLIRETSDGVVTVESALLQMPEYRALLASPAIGKEERLAALDQAFRGKIPDILLAILRMMVSRGQVSALSGMARDYEELARGYRGESMAVVKSAVPLKEAEAVHLAAEGIREKLQKDIPLEDPEKFRNSRRAFSITSLFSTLGFGMIFSLLFFFDVFKFFVFFVHELSPKCKDN